MDALPSLLPPTLFSLMPSSMRSLLSEVAAHAPHDPAITLLATGETVSFAEIATRARRVRRVLARAGLVAGDGLVASLPPGPALAVLLLACDESGLDLVLVGETEVAQAIAAVSPKLVVSGASTAWRAPRRIAPAELDTAEPDTAGPASTGPEPGDAPDRAILAVWHAGARHAIDAAARRRSVANLQALAPAQPGDTLLSASPPTTLDGLFISTVVPLALGLHVILADPGALDAALAHDAARTASMCELPAPSWRILARDGATPIELAARTLLCGSGTLRPQDAAAAARRFGRPVRRGFGTAASGLWAVPLGEAAPAERGTAELRPLRSPLHLGTAGPADATGEIVLRDAAGLEARTGRVGRLAPDGGLECDGDLSDVAVRHGRAVLLTDVDAALARHGAVYSSRTFREKGAAPTEAAVSVVLSTADEAELMAFLRRQDDVPHLPERLLVLPPHRGAALPPVPVLRRIANGQAGAAVLAALTARRFRRNPAHDEAGLIAAVDRALLIGEPLRFFMFWGCGPRRHAAEPDRAAIAALADLLAAAEAAAPLCASAHVICTDGHATNNGHSELHYKTYFGEIAALARGLPVSFELESAVWQRGGLTRADVRRLEAENGFAERWDRFPLQARFVQQASRHSRMSDKTAAARHYYATCLLEREVLRSQFAGSVFLTYNGPEFNECFPDVPTLYVYPGPRGPNDKPWFVDAAASDPDGAAEPLRVEAA